VVFAKNEGIYENAYLKNSSQALSYYISRAYPNVNKKEFTDDFAANFNYRSVVSPQNPKESIIPKERMFAALSEDMGLPAYRYRAFEILVTLDLIEYKAVRRLIVPARLPMWRLHYLLQEIYGWKNSHLHGWSVYDGQSETPVATLISKEEKDYGESGISEDDASLDEFFPAYPFIVYTYDWGDCWEHVIEFVKEYEEYGEESPYLAEAEGQTPPEDVGGVYGFLDFREIILDPENEEYEEMKDWVGHWEPELREYQKRPRVIHY